MKIVVLAGGLSTERDVSLSSGKRIYQALKSLRHQVILLDVYLGYVGEYTSLFTSEIQWDESIEVVGLEDPDLLQIKAMRQDGSQDFFGPNVLELCKEADVVFIGLHGDSGENGKIQAAFDLFHITYTGNDCMSSAIAMNKGVTKDLFRAYGIPTPQGLTLHRDQICQEEILFPCVVKTCCGGSSVGVYMATNEQELEEAKEKAFAYEEEVVIEEYIKGREFTVGVIEGKAMPIVEIEPLDGFYDYKNKYQVGATKETCPAHISDELTKQMQACAEQIFHVLRLTSYARMDFLCKEDGTFYCLEANTLPGMTQTSLLPQEAQAIGISFEELCQRIVNLAVSQANHKE
ncbi:MAG: D-alanine--D-alanine ligase [Eubacteriales bacterium]